MNDAETRYRLRLAHDYVAYGKGKFLGQLEAEMIKELRDLWAKAYDPRDAGQARVALIRFLENQAVRGRADDLLCTALWEPEKLLGIARALSEQKAPDGSSYMSRGPAPKLLMLYGAFRDSRPTLSDLRKAWPQYYSKPQKLKWPGDNYTRRLFRSLAIPLRQDKKGAPKKIGARKAKNDARLF